nr:hypothetical protein [Pseudomonas vanderleydeniana]
MQKQSVPLMPDHQLYTDAVAALKRSHEAQRNNSPAEAVKRLRLIAELLFQAATDYQLSSLGHQPLKPH